MNEAQQNAMASNWGETKGEAQSNRVNYMKVNKGRNQIRIVGNILRRYIYWVTNKEAKKQPFENLDFKRETESFESTGLNPVKELNMQSRTFHGELEFDKDGKPKPLGSKKAYMVPVINRATNQVEYMELKKGVFDGVTEVMAKLNDPRFLKRFVDPEYRVRNPSFIDIVFTKTGTGLNTEYKVDIMETMDFVTDEDMFEVLKGRHEQDASLLEDLKDIEEVFPRETYSEQKERLAKFLKGSSEGGKGTKDAPKAQEPSKTEFANYDSEALDDLES